MKKKILLLMVLTMTIVGSAMADQNWKRSNYRTEGLTFGTSAGLPQMWDVTFGWQIGPHWNLGVDFDAFFIYSGFDARYYILDDKMTPFVQAKVSLAPTLQVGYAFGKFELAVGASHYLAETVSDVRYPVFFPSFTIGYTFAFGKW